MLVQNATASQEKLAQAAQSSVATITRLAEVVKLGAASLGSEDPETQVKGSLLFFCLVLFLAAAAAGLARPLLLTWLLSALRWF